MMRTFVRIVSAFVFLLCSSSVAWTTSIVATVRGDELAIAADSLLVEPNGREEICKIHRVEQLYFATAGLLRKAEAGFFLDQLAKEACARGHDPDGAASRFRELVSEPLIKTMAYSKQHNPQRYKRDYLGRPAVASGVFVGYANQRPRIVMETFGLDPAGRLRVTGIALPDATGRNVLQVGQTRADDDYELSHPSWAGDLAPAELVKRLVEIEIRNEPQLVGPPISVLDALPSRWRWIEPGLCHY